LLEEEAQEKGWEAQHQQPHLNGNMMAAHMGAPAGFQPGMMAPPPGYEAYPPGMSGAEMGVPPPPPGSYALPAALLQQYPALAGIQWDQLPAGPPDDMEGDISGRSSFDASSGGEYYDDEDDAQGGPGYQQGQAPPPVAQGFDYVQQNQFGEAR
jgi:transcription factor CRZ1